MSSVSAAFAVGAIRRSMTFRSSVPASAPFVPYSAITDSSVSTSSLDSVNVIRLPRRCIASPMSSTEARERLDAMTHWSTSVALSDMSMFSPASALLRYSVASVKSMPAVAASVITVGMPS